MKINEQLKNSTQLKKKAIDSKEKRVSLILSDDTKVIRWSWQDGKYNLILKHDEDSIDLSRGNILKLFYNHGTDTLPLGKLENVRLEKGKLKADAIFDKEDSFAMEIFGKLERGFLDSVSVGITIHDGYMTEFESKTNEFTATKWELTEVSIVNIPANPKAGVGLSHQQISEKRKKMDFSKITKEQLSKERPDLVEVFVNDGLAQGAEQERLRISQIEEASVVGYESLTKAFKDDSTKTVTDFKLALFDKMKADKTELNSKIDDDNEELLGNIKKLDTNTEEQLSDEAKAIALMTQTSQKLGVK